MAKAVCPHPGCPGDDDGLVKITPTGKPRADKGTCTWWKVEPHWNDKSLCPGSNKLV